MSQWLLRSVQVSGGFLAGLNLSLPSGLICVIGPRGSGKSTLAEVFRYGIGGVTGASKSRLDLIQANLGSAVITLKTGQVTGDNGYTIRRTMRESASLVAADGKSVDSVDLDRGTFLPIDAYASSEIESIADESLGPKRRGLLDELRGDELHKIYLLISEKRRALDANADAIRAAVRLISDLTERVEGLGGARARLAALPQAASSESSTSLSAAAKQRQANEKESERVASLLSRLKSFAREIGELGERAGTGLNLEPIPEKSANVELLRQVNAELASAVNEVRANLAAAEHLLNQAEQAVRSGESRLAQAHQGQSALYAELQVKDHAASDAIRQRTAAEEAVTILETAEAQLLRARGELARLNEERKALKGEFLLERERISDLREGVAKKLEMESGRKVRVRVLRNGDNLNYRTALIDGLRGARVKNHDDILNCLMRLRPEQLAQIIVDQDADEFEHHTELGIERCGRILEAYRSNLDPLALEIIATDDRVSIELNVSASGDPNYKDASELSRGQKCTALLPLLLARRDNPLIIDQPEDNLDNHFIYETVVDSIRQLKTRRQMIFITHNANIPVLAEAELVVVMNSDGKTGYVEKAGTLDECRDEIIDLLEGGKQAFELRRRRYAGG